MDFANPKEPDTKRTKILDLIEAAVELSQKKKDIKKFEVKYKSVDKLGDVNVDGEQVIKAICNIIYNAVESYKDGGLVQFNGGCIQPEGKVVFEIVDKGCGMDELTVARAVEPFFSSKPAGRQRGMGLTQARRLVEVNNGSIHISSEPGKGTVVTVVLAKA
jgi:signal transduction histidine kinase